MSAISYTASYFSEQDERRELDELTDAEKEAILDDKYGRNINNNNDNDDNGGENNDDETNNNNGENEDNDDDVSDELLRNFFVALEQVDPEIGGWYWKAMMFHNDIFETESNPVRFLRCCNYNTERAALRLCEYWNMRVEIFGEEDAFKEMTLQGAMKDVVPYMVLLPNIFRILPNDDHGRTVLCLDRTNVQFKDYDDKIFLKIMWFVFHLAIQRSRSTQENGVVIIVINRESTWDIPSHNYLKLAQKSLYECLPLKICCRHGCISSLVATIVLPIVLFFLSRDARLRTQIHNSIKTPTILNELETYGLRRNNLPTSIGGTYDVKPPWIIECEHIVKQQRCRNKRQRETR